MQNKKILAGYTLIVAGVTALICLSVFVLWGYRILVKQEIEFEDEQFPQQTVIAVDTISIPGFDTWTIDAGETKVSTHFYNPEKNNCYFKLSIVLDETGETIYESKYIKPGQHLYEVELNRPIEAGKYKATLRYSTFTMDEELTPLNGAVLPFELVAD